MAKNPLVAKNFDYLIVVPAYNEAAAIGHLLDELCTAFDRRRILVIDDGSTDATNAIALRHSVRVLRHEKNKGKGAAIKTALANTRQPIVALIDADGQHNVHDLLRALALFKSSGVDLLIGNRYHCNATHVPFRALCNRIIQHLFAAAVKLNRGNDGFAIKDPLSGLRVFRRSAFQLKEDDYTTEIEMCFQALRKKLSVAEVPITTNYSARDAALNLRKFLVFGRIFLYTLKHLF